MAAQRLKSDLVARKILAMDETAIRQTDELSGQQVIRWMSMTRYLKDRKDTQSRQIDSDGEKLDMEAVWRVGDWFFPTAKARK